MIKRFLSRLRSGLRRVFKGKSSVTIGIYGSPNAGKTMLANRVCEDWDKEALGSVSNVPHETRRVQVRQQVVLRNGGRELAIDVMDTPGLASSASAMDLEIFYQMDPSEARARAKEATDGMLDAIRKLETLDGMILVIDSATDPYQQVNTTLLAHVRARNLPVVIAANKIDLKEARPDKVAQAFHRFKVVPVSAKDHKNFEALYEAILDRFA